MYALNTKKISSGFTTIEVIIATGWTSLLLLAAYSGFSSIMGQNQATKMMVGQNEFVSSISQEIALPSKCSNNLSTITLPAPGTNLI